MLISTNISTHANPIGTRPFTSAQPLQRPSTAFFPTSQTDSLNFSGFGMMMMRMMASMMQTFSMMQGSHRMPLASNSPLQQFLGPQSPQFGRPSGLNRSHTPNFGRAPVNGHGLSPSTTPQVGGRIQNFNITRLIQALPASRRRSAQRHFPVIIQEAQRQGVTNKAQLAYILATATHESGAGAFMEEFASGRAYEGRGDLGNTRRGDGRRFKGRGYVQLTGRRNYRDWSRRLGIDIVSNPDRVKEPRIAARILVEGMMRGTFTGKGLGSYINGSQTDFRNARRVVNGTDRAGHIGSIAQRLLRAMS